MFSILLLFPSFPNKFENNLLKIALTGDVFNQVFFLFFTFLILSILYFKFINIKELNPKKNNDIKNQNRTIFFYSLLALIFSFLLIEIFFINFFSGNTNSSLNSQNIADLFLYQIQFKILLLLILAPIVEEFIFRKYYIDILIKAFKGKTFFIYSCQFFLFIIFHISNFNNPFTILALKNLLILGILSLVLTKILLETKNIAFPILVHSLWNFFSIIQNYLILVLNHESYNLIMITLIITLFMIIICILFKNKEFPNSALNFKIDLKLIIELLLFFILISQFFLLNLYDFDNEFLVLIINQLKIIYTILFVFLTLLIVFLITFPRKYLRKLIRNREY